MKKIIFLLSIIVPCLVITSCTLEPSNNEELDGYWCLAQVDTLDTGHTVDYRSERVFWAFQGEMMQTQQLKESQNLDKYIYTFEKNGLTLNISNPLHNERTIDDSAITEDILYVLRPHGINNLFESFDIEKLTGSEMILKGQILRLHFVKY